MKLNINTKYNITLMVYTDYTTFRPVEAQLIQGPTICPLKGGVGDLVCVRVFFSQPSGERILFPDIQRCKFFSQHYTT